MVKFTLCKWHLKKLPKKKRWCHSFVQNFPVCLTHASQLPRRLYCSRWCCLFDIFFSWHAPADSSHASLTVLLAVPPNISLLLSQDFCTCCSLSGSLLHQITTWLTLEFSFQLCSQFPFSEMPTQDYQAWNTLHPTYFPNLLSSYSFLKHLSLSNILCYLIKYKSIVYCHFFY